MGKYKNYTPARKRYHNWRVSAHGKQYFQQMFENTKGICQRCGDKMIFSFEKFEDPKKATFDHIIPLVLNPEHSTKNLIMVCHECNQMKGHNYGSHTPSNKEILLMKQS